MHPASEAQFGNDFPFSRIIHKPYWNRIRERVGIGRVDDCPVPTPVEAVFITHVIGVAVEFDGGRRIRGEPICTLELA
ncbi:hypothetical protein D3C71_1110680 [compost metagenome]